jgi:glutathione S-transferase kappa 1
MWAVVSIKGSHNPITDYITITTITSNPDTATGNKPPWTNPIKAAYGNFDLQRAKQYHNLLDLSTPSFFPILSLLASSPTRRS